MSKTMVTTTPETRPDAPPPFEPDKDLMADAEGSERAVRAYKAKADALVAERASHG
jgi:hypothetical protein